MPALHRFCFSQVIGQTYLSMLCTLQARSRALSGAQISMHVHTSACVYGNLRRTWLLSRQRTENYICDVMYFILMRD